MKQWVFFLFVGLLFLFIGVLYYFLVRGVSQLLPLYIFENGYTAPLNKYINSKSSDILYFFWSSFPSFIATFCSTMFLKPFFKSSENLLLCSGVFIIMTALELLKYHYNLAGIDLICRYDTLDILAIFMASLFSFIFITNVDRRLKSENF